MTQHIRLVMIVCNEERCIERCLTSVRDQINSYLIVDTGSKDRTKRIIQACMRGIPGKVYNRKWVDFGTNRTQALELARKDGEADWLFTLDADEEAFWPKDWHWEYLKDYPDIWAWHMLFFERQPDMPLGIPFQRLNVLKADKPFYYHGVIHEQPRCDGEWQAGLLCGPRIDVHTDGSRDRSSDEQLLRQVWESTKDPQYLFFLAKHTMDHDLELAKSLFAEYVEVGKDEPFVAYALGVIGDK